MQAIWDFFQGDRGRVSPVVCLQECLLRVLTMYLDPDLILHF